MPNLVKTSTQQPVLGGPPILCEDSDSYRLIGDNTGANVGSSGVGVFDGQVGAVLNFRKLNASTGLSGALNGQQIDLAWDIPGIMLGTPGDVTQDLLGYYRSSSSGYRKMPLKTFWDKVFWHYLTAGGDMLYRAPITGLPTRLAIGSTEGMILGVNSGKTAPEWVTLKVSCGWLIQTPTVSDDGLIGLFPVGLEYTITKIRHAISGGTNVVFNLEKRTAPFSSGTQVWSSDKTASSTSWTDETSFNSASVPADSCLATKITSVSGTVNWLAIGAQMTIKVHS